MERVHEGDAARLWSSIRLNPRSLNKVSKGNALNWVKAPSNFPAIPSMSSSQFMHLRIGVPDSGQINR